MKAFLDTSVLVPVFYGDHEHHAASMKIFCKRRKDSVSFSGATRHPRSQPTAQRKFSNRKF